ncbi:MAG: GNAT family N-acetyltransferase [Beijerinckiaceae bacterium]|nr:GNAT family N-acetyltransferase [Beijerinckiaceae bacterium]
MSASAFPKPALRPMLPTDGPLLATIFQASIEELTEEDYDEGQRQAWASAVDDDEAFAQKLGGWLTLIATVQGSPVGFIALKGADHIEMFYVHPAVARQGVGTMLYEAIEKLAAGRGAKKLTVDASDTARVFFEMKGFEPRHRQTVAIGDYWLGNTRMERAI